MMLQENEDARIKSGSTDPVYIRLCEMLASPMFIRDRKSTIKTKELRLLFETNGGTKMTSHVFNKLIEKYCNFHVHVTMTRVCNAKSIQGLQLVTRVITPEVVEARIAVPQLPIYLPSLKQIDVVAEG